MNASTLLKTDTLILGAGVIGSSVSDQLSRLCDGGASGASGAQGVSGEITVVDLDLEGVFSSTELNAGGVRTTFGSRINQLCSEISIDYYSKHAADVGYRDTGYLWLRSREQFEQAKAAFVPNASFPIEFLSVSEVKSMHPFLDRLDEVHAGIFGKRDGLINPNRLKNHYRDQARARGVKFIDRFFIESIVWDEGASHFLVSGVLFDGEILSEAKRALFSDEGAIVSSASAVSQGRRVSISCSRLVNTLGAWADRFVSSLGLLSVSKPYRRQMSLFDCREVDSSRVGMIIEPNGVYFHGEAQQFLGGVVVDEPSSYSFEYDGADFFETHLWSNLAEVSSHFEKLRHLSGWAGLYEVSPDHSAIIGGASDGSGASAKLRDRYFEAHSFSGHGVMHSYAAGLGLAELIVKGRFETIDLSALSRARFLSGATVVEKQVI